jgi:hypothetical protein
MCKNGGRIPIAPLCELPETTQPMQITSTDIGGPYPIIADRIDTYSHLLVIFLHIGNLTSFRVRTQRLSPQHLSHRCLCYMVAPRYFRLTAEFILSSLFQEICKLLRIKRINSAFFNPNMQGKI